MTHLIHVEERLFFVSGRRLSVAGVIRRIWAMRCRYRPPRWWALAGAEGNFPDATGFVVYRQA